MIERPRRGSAPSICAIEDVLALQDGDVIRLGVPAEEGVAAVRRRHRRGLPACSPAATAGSWPCRCTSASRAIEEAAAEPADDDAEVAP